jgi:hypothetical protein
VNGEPFDWSERFAPESWFDLLFTDLHFATAEPILRVRSFGFFWAIALASMKRFLLFCLVLPLAGGCDAFRLSDESSIVNGSWSSTVAAVSGACCQLEIEIKNKEGQLTGSGTVETPGRRVGTSDVYSIAFTGSLSNDRVDLELDSEFNTGTIVGRVLRDFSTTYTMVLEVDFKGFGYEGEDIILFPRSE